MRGWCSRKRTAGAESLQIAYRFPAQNSSRIRFQSLAEIRLRRRTAVACRMARANMWKAVAPRAIGRSRARATSTSQLVSQLLVACAGSKGCRKFKNSIYFGARPGAKKIMSVPGSPQSPDRPPLSMPSSFTEYKTGSPCETAYPNAWFICGSFTLTIRSSAAANKVSGHRP